MMIAAIWCQIPKAQGTPLAKRLLVKTNVSYLLILSSNIPSCHLEKHSNKQKILTKTKNNYNNNLSFLYILSTNKLKRIQS